MGIEQANLFRPQDTLNAQNWVEHGTNSLEAKHSNYHRNNKTLGEAESNDEVKLIKINWEFRI